MTIKKSSNKKNHISQDREAAFLRRIIDIVNSELDLQSVLKEVVHLITEITGADSVFIYLLDGQKRNLILNASKTPHKKELGKIVLGIGEGLTGWVAKENKIVSIKQQAYSDPRFKSFDVLPEDRYEAFLSVPILYKKKPIGVVNVQYKKAHDLTENLQGVVSTVAKQISGAIVNAQLFDHMRQKAVQFDSLVKVSQSITSKQYLEEILNLIVVVTAEMLNSKICSVMLLGQNGKELAIKATQSLSDEYKKKPNVKVNGSISGEVLKQKTPRAIYDVQKEERYFYRDLAVKENLTSMLSVPMVFKDQAIGIVNVYTKEPHHFSEEETNVLQMVANQAAVAVENTKLMEEALKAKEALEARKLIDRAKGILMRLADLTEEESHKLIHKKSMDSCKTMKEVAESILLMDEIQKNGSRKR